YGASYFYQRGWKAFAAQDYRTALWNFSRAIELGGESSTAADGTFFRAASLLRSSDPAGALAGYRAVIERFPESVWVAESHYHVGLCLRQLGRRREAKARFRYVLVTYSANRCAGFAAAVAGTDAVVHLGAATSAGRLDPAVAYRVNVGGATALIAAARAAGCTRIVVMSTQHVHLPRPGLYGLTKRMADRLFLGSGLD